MVSNESQFTLVKLDKHVNSKLLWSVTYYWFEYLGKSKIKENSPRGIRLLINHSTNKIQPVDFRPIVYDLIWRDAPGMVQEYATVYSNITPTIYCSNLNSLKISLTFHKYDTMANVCACVIP